MHCIEKLVVLHLYCVEETGTFAVQAIYIFTAFKGKKSEY